MRTVNCKLNSAFNDCYYCTITSQNYFSPYIGTFRRTSPHISGLQYATQHGSFYYPSSYDHKLSAYPEKFNALSIDMICHVLRFISTISKIAMKYERFQLSTPELTRDITTFSALSQKIHRILNRHFAVYRSLRSIIAWKILTSIAS